MEVTKSFIWIGHKSLVLEISNRRSHITCGYVRPAIDTHDNLPLLIEVIVVLLND